MMCCGEFDLPKIDRRLVLKALGLLATSQVLEGCTSLSQLSSSDKFPINALPSSFPHSNQIDELKGRLEAKRLRAKPDAARALEIQGVRIDTIPFEGDNIDNAILAYVQYDGAIVARARIFKDNGEKIIDLEPGKPDYMVVLLKGQEHGKIRISLIQTFKYQEFKKKMTNKGFQIAEHKTQIAFDGERYKAVLFLYKHNRHLNKKWPPIPDAIGMTQWYYARSKMSALHRWDYTSLTTVDIQYFDPGSGGGGTGGSSGCDVWKCISTNPLTTVVCGLECLANIIFGVGTVLCLLCMIGAALCGNCGGGSENIAPAVED